MASLVAVQGASWHPSWPCRGRHGIPRGCEGWAACTVSANAGRPNALSHSFARAYPPGAGASSGAHTAGGSERALRRDEGE
jgi:hypothetical protein